MVRARFIPVTLEENEEVMTLTSDEYRILITLMVRVDDFGRGKSFPMLIAGYVHMPIEKVEAALPVLAAHDLIELYTVDGKSYYAICRWETWNTIAENKRTPSRIPPPPGLPRIPLGNPGNPWPKEEVEVEVESKGERESKSITSVVVEGASPPTHDDDHGVRNSVPSQSRGTTGEGTITHLVDQVAGALKIPVHDELLVALVRDYTTNHPQISLVSEAHVARAWINGPKNTARKGMSSVFFKGWLDRERRSSTPVPPAKADTGGAKETPPNQYTARSLDPEHNKQQLEKLRQAVEQQRAREAAKHG